MSEDTLSDTELGQDLAEGALVKKKLTLVEAVKSSGQAGYIFFPQTALMAGPIFQRS